MYWGVLVNTPSTFAFRDCDGENQAGASGMFIRTSRNGTPSPCNLYQVSLEHCIAFDPVSGSSPWTIIYACNGLTGAEWRLFNAACANANTSQIKAEGAGGNLRGLDVSGSGSGFRVVDSSNNPHPGLYGYRYDNGFLKVNVSHTPYLGVGVSPELNMQSPAGAGNADLWGINGETYARFALTFDGYLWWMDGTSATADTNLYRSAADTLKTDDSFTVGATLRAADVRPTSTLTLTDGINIVAATTAGSQIGTGSTQKLGFFGATPITRVAAGSTSLDQALSNLGLIGASAGWTLRSGDHTHAEATNMILGTSNGTKIGTATNQKLGFWNATPIVQPTTAGAAATFVANTSGIANDSATFDGYTIGQVVKALRNMGALA
jgi:hypothetical protein